MYGSTIPGGSVGVGVGGGSPTPTSSAKKLAASPPVLLLKLTALPHAPRVATPVAAGAVHRKLNSITPPACGFGALCVISSRPPVPTIVCVLSEKPPPSDS